MRLAPWLLSPETLRDMHEAWRDRGSIRVEPFLDEDVARTLLAAARAQPYSFLCSQDQALAFQYLVSAMVPETDCDHLLCEFGRWLWSQGVAWASEVTGIALAPSPDGQLVLTHFDKGSYLDPHTDYDAKRRVAFVIGLTDTTWPAEDGGHLEFLAADARGVRVAERRSPGWNTIDLFDVRAPDRPHVVPILRRRAERRAISGWFY